MDTVATIKQLFPQLDEKQIKHVLAVAGGNPVVAINTLLQTIQSPIENADKIPQDIGYTSRFKLHGAYRSRCGYCGTEKGNASYGMKAKQMTVQHYQDLIDRGWRRSGTFMYKPNLKKACCKLYTIRLDVTKFCPSKSQKKVLRKIDKFLSDKRNTKDNFCGLPAGSEASKGDSLGNMARVLWSALVTPNGEEASPGTSWNEPPSRVLPAKKRPRTKLLPQAEDFHSETENLLRATITTAVESYIVACCDISATLSAGERDAMTNADALWRSFRLQKYGSRHKNSKKQESKTPEQAYATNVVSLLAGSKEQAAARKRTDKRVTEGREPNLEVSLDPVEEISEHARVKEKAEEKGSITNKSEQKQKCKAKRRQWMQSASGAIVDIINSLLGAYQRKEHEQQVLLTGAKACARGPLIVVSLPNTKGSEASVQKKSQKKQQGKAEEHQTKSNAEDRRKHRLEKEAKTEPHRLDIIMMPSEFSEEEYGVYKRYQIAVHGDKPSKVTKRGYERFLCKTPLIPISSKFTEFGGQRNTKEEEEEEEKEEEAADATLKEASPESVTGSHLPECGYGSFHQQYRLDGKLIAVGVVDILPKCLSSVYFFFDPEYKFLSLGVYSAMKEAGWVQSMNAALGGPCQLRYYYMGYYIHTCPKMVYKGAYKPSDLLCPESFTWVPLSRCLPALDKRRYNRLASGDVPDDTEGSIEDLEVLKLVYEEDRFISASVLTEEGRELVEGFVRGAGRAVASQAYLDV